MSSIIRHVGLVGYGKSESFFHGDKVTMGPDMAGFIYM